MTDKDKKAGSGEIAFDFGTPEDPRPSDWQMAAMCRECGFQVAAVAGDLADALRRFGCCPKCGALILRETATHDKPFGYPFRLVRRRWMNTGLVAGYYEVHREDR